MHSKFQNQLSINESFRKATTNKPGLSTVMAQKISGYGVVDLGGRRGWKADKRDQGLKQKGLGCQGCGATNRGGKGVAGTPEE